MKRWAVVLLVLLLVAGAFLFGPRLLRAVGADLGGFSGGGDYGGGDSGWSGGSDWGSGTFSWGSDDDDGGHGFFYFPIGVFNDSGDSPEGYGGF